MTPKELKQPLSVFKTAGKNAFLIGVDLLSNPHKTEPFRSLWVSGYQRESRNHPFHRRQPYTGVSAPDPFEVRWQQRRKSVRSA